MSGSREGGLKAAETNKAKHGADFYQRIGRRGGQNGVTGGFYNNPKLAKMAGKKGGTISRRGAGQFVRTKIEPIAEEIMADYNAGLQVSDIAKKYGLPYKPLYAWIYRYGKEGE